MSHAHRSRKGLAADLGEDEAGALTAKVVLMELVDAAGPMTGAALEERTLLSRVAIDSALSDLAAAGLCTELPGDDRRPPRYVVEGSSTGDPDRHTSAR